MGLPNAFFGLAFFKTPFLGSKSGNKRALLLLLSLLHSFLLNRKSLSLSLSLSNQIPNFISLISLLLLPFQFLLAKSIKERKNQYLNFILWDFAVSSAAIRRTQDQERISPILQALDVLWIHHSEVSIHFKRDYTVSFTLNG